MKQFYRRNLPHIQEFDAVYFVTFRTKGDLFLPPPARSVALRHVLFEDGGCWATDSELPSIRIPPGTRA
ncbi:MAG TPA: hypothetical protein VI488_13090, partial [Candidatus Angelobacter sp.]